MEKSKATKGAIADLEQKEKDVIAARDAALLAIGNIVHDSVPVSDDEVRAACGCCSCCVQLLRASHALHAFEFVCLGGLQAAAAAA